VRQQDVSSRRPWSKGDGLGGLNKAGNRAWRYCESSRDKIIRSRGQERLLDGMSRESRAPRLGTIIQTKVMIALERDRRN